MEEQTKISDQIRTIRSMSYMTQAEFAIAVGVEQATVSRWERGAEPSLDNLKAIARLAKDAGLVLEGFDIFGGVRNEVENQRGKIDYLGELQNKGWSRLSLVRPKREIKDHVLSKIREFQYPAECEAAVSLEGEFFETDFRHGDILILGRRFARPTAGSEARLCLMEGEDDFFLGEPHSSGDAETFNIMTKQRLFSQQRILSARRVIAIVL